MTTSTGRNALLLLGAILLLANLAAGCGTDTEDPPLSEATGQVPDGSSGSPPRGGSGTQEAGAPQGCPAWPSVALEERTLLPGISVQVTHAGDGTGRLFVVEQEGRIRVVQGGTLLPTPFLDITDRVLYSGEQGLMAVAFPPGYSRKGYFYVNYARQPDGASVIARYFLAPGRSDRTDPQSEEVLLTVPQPFATHNANQIAFGPDGLLYVSLGDGGASDDFQGNAQNPDSLLGKILRLDVESGAFPYAVPADNPFVGQSGFREEIWALGLRNPWRFSFDRATGDLYIADVGNARWEEVNVQSASSPGGENYGWNVMEGAHCFSPLLFCQADGLTLPVYEYNHFQGCSIIGGFVYRGAAHPCLRGTYLYSDFCTGGLWGLKEVDGDWQASLLTDTALDIVSFGEDEEGELFALDLHGGLYAIAVP